MPETEKQMHTGKGIITRKRYALPNLDLHLEVQGSLEKCTKQYTENGNCLNFNTIFT